MPAGVEAPQGRTVGGFLLLGDGIVQSRRHRLSLLPLWEKVSPKATDEGCSRESQRLTPLEHPSSVSALRADPPSPTWGEGERAAATPVPRNGRWSRHIQQRNPAQCAKGSRQKLQTPAD
ncbi:hypothetical protein EOA28_17475 [Mesorhizobium sp. M2A.F.Ca.ET.067.02.1.1]|nr:hypothetical protein EOA28_17475 [Mesorhizobium sp. M2A.F.Ca.ET.067.02.1.1]